MTSILLNCTITTKQRTVYTCFLRLISINISQFCQLDLRKFLRLYGPIQDVKVATKIFKQLADGLFSLHSKNIIHRDLKPDNILIKTSQQSLKALQLSKDISAFFDDSILKISDFGVSIQLLDGNVLAFSQTGSWYYQAPEVLRDEGYSRSCDVYSLGKLFLECIDNSSDASLYSLVNLINQMIEEDPQQRITIDKVIQYLDKSSQTLSFDSFYSNNGDSRISIRSQRQNKNIIKIVSDDQEESQTDLTPQVQGKQAHPPSNVSCIGREDEQNIQIIGVSDEKEEVQSNQQQEQQTKTTQEEVRQDPDQKQYDRMMLNLNNRQELQNQVLEQDHSPLQISPNQSVMQLDQNQEDESRPNQSLQSTECQGLGLDRQEENSQQSQDVSSVLFSQKYESTNIQQFGDVQQIIQESQVLMADQSQQNLGEQQKTENQSFFSNQESNVVITDQQLISSEDSNINSRLNSLLKTRRVMLKVLNSMKAKKCLIKKPQEAFDICLKDLAFIFQQSRSASSIDQQLEQTIKSLLEQQKIDLNSVIQCHRFQLENVHKNEQVFVDSTKAHRRQISNATTKLKSSTQKDIKQLNFLVQVSQKEL